MFIKGPIPFSYVKSAFDDSEAESGANTFFVGKVRADSINNSFVESIEYTAHTEIAERISLEIIEVSKKKFGIIYAKVWHSIGTVCSGEACFLVSVSGRHRDESFKALQYIVNEVKKQCPVFGKEIIKDGTYQWKTTRESVNTEE